MKFFFKRELAHFTVFQQSQVSVVLGKQSQDMGPFAHSVMRRLSAQAKVEQLTLRFSGSSASGLILLLQTLGSLTDLLLI